MNADVSVNFPEPFGDLVAHESAVAEAHQAFENHQHGGGYAHSAAIEWLGSVDGRRRQPPLSPLSIAIRSTNGWPLSCDDILKCSLTCAVVRRDLYVCGMRMLHNHDVLPRVRHRSERQRWDELHLIQTRSPEIRAAQAANAT